jgi:tRNA threonylcarbamoyl adenosine modification protein (Sua5/YciO/YrdC/YwlC family)
VGDDDGPSPHSPANDADSTASEPAEKAGTAAERTPGDEPKDTGDGTAEHAAEDAQNDASEDGAQDPARNAGGDAPGDAAKGADGADAAGDTAEDAAKGTDGGDAGGDDAEEAEEPAPARRRYDCSDAEQRAAGLADAAGVLKVGELVVLPTDTVYGVGADAFTASAVSALMLAKGRGRDIPVPVLVGTVRAATALVDDLGTYGQDLIDEFWPGPLTLICKAGRSLRWDIGDTKGTVAIRMPLHQLALDLLKETGPLAVSSANLAGAPAATTAAEAEQQLGDSVSVYLDGGPCADGTPSTILDLTTPVPRLLRRGAISVEKLRGIIGYVATED